jgi:hypothetical protein
MVSDGELNVYPDLKFEPLESLEQSISKIHGGAIGLGGISDNYGLPYMELYFPEMAAKSSKKYLVKIDASKYKDASTVKFIIGRYSKQPNPIIKMPVNLNKDGNFPQKLILPENMGYRPHPCKNMS